MVDDASDRHAYQRDALQSRDKLTVTNICASAIGDLGVAIGAEGMGTRLSNIVIQEQNQTLSTLLAFVQREKGVSYQECTTHNSQPFCRVGID